MAKLILNSVLIAAVVIPMMAAGDPSPRRALRRAVLWVIAFHAAYVLAIAYVYPRLL
jgi:hypothetical protein